MENFGEDTKRPAQLASGSLAVCLYADQKLPILEDGLRKAILRYGAPKSLYVDNGKIFTSTWLQLACARLNIRHLKTRPYSPEAKGYAK
jgi:transposase InsO family protein